MIRQLRIFLLSLTFLGFVFASPTLINAAEPSVCQSGGFCMAQGNTCNDGTIITDTSCAPVGPPSCNTYGGYCRDLDTTCSSGTAATTDTSCVNSTNNPDGNACCYTSNNPFFSGKACCNDVTPPPSGPPNCPNGGYCVNFGVACRNGSTRIQDPVCIDNLFNKNGDACCNSLSSPSPTPNTSVCGSPNEAGTCVDLSGNTISGATTCSRNSTVCCSPASGCDDVFPIENIIDGPSKDFFDGLNPLKNNTDPELFGKLSTPGGIVSRLLQFLFPISGLILFIMLIWGGFEILVKSAQGTKAVEAGRNRITAAIVGFLLLFATYWMAQIIEAVFGIVIV